MTSLENRQQAKVYLRGKGLRVTEDVVRQVVDILRGASSSSIYNLSAHGRYRDGRERRPVCAPKTAGKIERLYNQGKLAQYVEFLEFEKQRGLAHSKAGVHQIVLKPGDQVEIAGGPDNLGDHLLQNSSELGAEQGVDEPRNSDESHISRVSGLNISTTLVDDQIKGVMNRHCQDLRNKAGKWRDRIGRLNFYELRFKLFSTLDYTGKFPSSWIMPYVDSNEFAWSLGGDGTLLFRCMLGHLREEVPATLEHFRKWQECLRYVVCRITERRSQWQRVIDGHVKDELARFERQTPGHPDSEFATTLWKKIMGDHFRVPHGFNGLSYDEYQLMQSEGDVYTPFYPGEKIGEGTEQWTRHLAALHERLYKEYKDKLRGELESIRLPDAIYDLLLQSERAYEGLNIVAHGASVFIPGNCVVCRQLTA